MAGRKDCFQVTLILPATVVFPLLILRYFEWSIKNATHSVFQTVWLTGLYIGQVKTMILNLSLKQSDDREEKSESMRYIWLTARYDLYSHRSTPRLMEIILGLPWEGAKPRRSHWKSNMQGTVHMKVFMEPYSVPHSLFHSPLPFVLRVLSSSGLCKLCGFGKPLHTSQ